MAKATRQKLEDTLPAEEILAQPSPEVYDAPKSETLNDEPRVNNKPVIEEKQVIEETSKVVEPPKPAYRKEMDATLPMEERIVAFMESRKSGDYIKMNDFLKSLYGTSRLNEPPKWMKKGEAKRLGVLLENMRLRGVLTIKGDNHRKLGSQYYEGNEMYSKHNSLHTISIEAKI